MVLITEEKINDAYSLVNRTQNHGIYLELELLLRIIR
jgi:hypothetical protein